MAQFYLLSVFTNIAAGMTIAGDYLGDRIALLSSFKNLQRSRIAQILVGSAAFIVGVMTFIIRAPGDTVAVVGDFLPSVAGIAQGALLLIAGFRNRIAAVSAPAENLSKQALTYKVPVGIVGVAVGLLHFLFPAAVIL
jgi:hypothetical protein